MYTVGSKTDETLIYKAQVVSVPADPMGFEPIKCRIGVADAKIELKDNVDLSDCYPLLPKHLNVYPKVGEYVYIFTLNKNQNQQLRFFLGPIIDTFEHLSKNDADTLETNADVRSNKKSPPTIIGIYPQREWISIQGRENSDIVFKPQEVLIRAGKHKFSQPLVFNGDDAGYIQIKYGDPETKEVLKTEKVREVKIREFDGFVTATLINAQVGIYDYQVSIRVTDKNNNFVGILYERFTGRENAILFIKETFLELLNNSNPKKRSKILDTNGKEINPSYDLSKFRYLENGIPELKDWIVGINKTLETKLVEKTVRTTETIFGEKGGSVVNVVGDKINLISHANKPKFKLLDPNQTITPDQQLKINSESQPIPYGLILNDFLGLVKSFVANHVHPYHGLPPDPDPVVTQILNYDLNTILNQNVRTA